jgi:uncharacterized peroxidase-related enzyme
MTADYKLSLSPQDLDSSSAAAREVLGEAKAALGFVPNMYKGMANAPGLLKTYLDGYARFRGDSGFTPEEQELVFLATSRYNGCGYCMSAHSMLAEKKSNMRPEVLSALRDGQPIPDDKLAELERFTTIMVDTRGRPGSADVERFLGAGYTEEQVLQVVLAIAVKTLSNYSNHLTHPEVDDVFAGHKWNGSTG